MTVPPEPRAKNAQQERTPRMKWTWTITKENGIDDVPKLTSDTMRKRKRRFAVRIIALNDQAALPFMIWIRRSAARDM